MSKNSTKETNPEDFFKMAKAHSKIKADIVTDYVITWAKIIINGRISANRNPSRTHKQDEKSYYVDLFSGCGIYEDGTESTPIKIIRKAQEIESLRNNLILRFNDHSPEMITRLQRHINRLNPQFHNQVKCTSLDAEGSEIMGWFHANATGRRLPMLVFIDPFGYKQISQELLRTIIQVPQSDIILFFNYKRINAALDNELFESNMNKLFGEDLVKNIQADLKTARRPERENIILGYLERALKATGANYVCPFLVVPEDENHTSHYIVGMSKHEKGYEALKKVMKQHSHIGNGGKTRFGYDPGSLIREQQMSMFGCLPEPVEVLITSLRKCFANTSISFGELYRQHHPTADFTPDEYRKAIKTMIKDGNATLLAPENVKVVSGEVTMPDHTMIYIK